MSNFLVWFGISLILACLTQAGFTIGDENLVILWKILGSIAGTIDIIRVMTDLKTGDHKMTGQEFRALLDLFMCSDPWPVVDQGNGDGHDTIEDLLNTEAKSRGYMDWIDAYHGFKPQRRG